MASYVGITMPLVMDNYVIDQTQLGEQKISNANLREVNELDKEMKDIYEITFVVKIKQDPNEKKDNGIQSKSLTEDAQLRSEQDGQVFLGIRKDSLKAFWTHTNMRVPIRNDQDRDLHQNRNFGPQASVSRALSESRSQNFNQAEYVEVQLFNTQHIEIKWMFNNPERVAPHFEFEFKLGSRQIDSDF